MCINKRWISIYKGSGNYQRLLVNCGRCAACLQEKSDRRASRIRNGVRDGYCFLFVTLTYADECCPYILRDDLRALQLEHAGESSSCEYEVPVYRDCKDYRSSRWSSDKDYCRSVYRKFLRGDCDYVYKCGYKRTYKTVRLKHVHKVRNYELMHTRSLFELRTLKRSRDPRRVGVIYYPDLQNFLKRFRQNLLRNYEIIPSFVYFGCAEYGPTTCRPHFHLLIECPLASLSTWKRAIAQSWSFDNGRVRQYIEVARNAASYVSSYVNCGSYVPAILRYGSFRPRHSFSPLLGFGSDVFSVSEVVEAVRRGDITYPRQVFRGGLPVTVSVPFPKYVISRYFPKFKGFNRFTTDEMFGLLLEPQRVFEADVSVRLGCTYRNKSHLSSSLTDGSFVHDLKDNRRIYQLIRNKMSLYETVLDDEYLSGSYVSAIDYAFCWSRVWSLYSSTLLRMSHEEAAAYQIPLSDYFDNSDAFFSGEISYDGIVMDSDYISDPNHKKSNLMRHNYFNEKYFKLDKSRKIINYSMSFAHNV